MSNPKEGYAFITKESYNLHASVKWPNSIDVGSRYKLITFCLLDELDLESDALSLGFITKRLGAQGSVDEMDFGKEGPFIVYGNDVHTVVNYYNPVDEEE